MLLFRNEEGTWEGLLNDWKLSKRRDQQDKKERQLDCTGTWQFMSANVLNDRTKSVLIEDELESFFHALLHLAVRFLPHNLANAHVPQFLHDYFDDYSVVGTQLRCGKTKLSAMIDGFIDISTYKIKRKDPHQLEFLVPTNASGPSTSDSTSSSEFASATSAGGHPINDVLEPWLSWLSAQYTLDRLRELESRTRMETEADGADASQDFTNGFMRVVAKVRQRSHKAGNTKDTSAATKAGKVATKTSTDGHATLIERAKKISSHTATLELLEVVLSKSRWPPLPDRVAERGATKLKQRIGSEADD
ncbi:hypothetical protein C8Q78DRAFT_1041631 [Trametes maxima]|nr:hypothetical protein C8Q78DRAFT_1041631 [Trametes maxima]